MRAKEFIKEQKLSDAHDGLDIVAKALPNTFVIPELKNQDFYELYRFGVAIADVRGQQGTDNVNNYKPEFRPETAWGENQVISSFDPNVGNVIDQALKKVNKSGKKAVSTPGSDELDDTMSVSPIKPFKGL
jgi:hypothetical protein